MSTRSSKELECCGSDQGQSARDKLNSQPLNQRQEQLLMRLCDCELGPIGRLRARRLLRTSILARGFVAEVNSVRSSLCDVSYSEKCDLWSRIDAAIENEEFAERLLQGDLGRSRQQDRSSWGDSFRQLGWGASGILVTAGLLAVAVRFGPIPVPTSTSPFGAVTRATVDSDGSSPAAASSGIYILNDHSQPAMEVDWMRSVGSVRVIPDSRDRNTILWVKRPKRAAVAGDSISNGSFVPSAIPQFNN